jgi:putative transcription antitermination factor YqgF
MKRFMTCRAYLKTHKVLNDPTMSRHFLGLDVGSKFIGVAISDYRNEIATPHTVINRTPTNNVQICNELSKQCHDFMVQAIVVGAPLSHPAMIERIQQYINEVWDVNSPHNLLKDIPVIMQDESLSTHESYEEFTQDYREGGYRSRINKMKKSDKEWVDKLSAAKILQRALDKINRIQNERKVKKEQ